MPGIHSQSVILVEGDADEIAPNAKLAADMHGFVIMVPERAVPTEAAGWKNTRHRRFVLNGNSEVVARGNNVVRIAFTSDLHIDITPQNRGFLPYLLGRVCVAPLAETNS